MKKNNILPFFRRKFGLKKETVRKQLRPLFIPTLAFITFAIVTYCSPKILKHKEGEDVWDPELVNRKPYTRHEPYISEAITDFQLNAERCPGSPPLHEGIMTYKAEIGREQSLPLNVFYKRIGAPSKGDRPTVQGAKSGPRNDNTTASNHFDALFLVCSDVKKIAMRGNFREIYGSFNNTSPYRIKVVFLVGQPSTEDGLAQIREESQMYSDIVMGNFIESYDNLTYKTIMGFRWVRTHCRNIELLLKMDDDVLMDVYRFMEFFKPRISMETRTIFGNVHRVAKVIRIGKYIVSRKEWKKDLYPDFCSGFFIVPTLDIIDDLYSMSKDIRFFRMEDVYSYGIVRSNLLDVQLIDLDFITTDSIEFINCFFVFRYKCKFLASQVSNSLFMAYWRQLVSYRLEAGVGVPEEELKNL